MNLASSLFGGGDKSYWVSGTTYAQGKTVRSPTDHQLYVRAVAGAGTTDPASDATNWAPDGARAIKSIQRVTVSIASGASVGNTTITAVNPAKSVLSYLGGMGVDSGAGAAWIPLLSLFNSTTVRATAPGNTGGISMGVQVVEYW